MNRKKAVTEEPVVKKTTTKGTKKKVADEKVPNITVAAEEVVSAQEPENTDALLIAIDKLAVDPKKVHSAEVVNATPADTGKIWFRKVGNGTFLLDKNTRIKPGQRFLARPDQIPKAFIDACIPLHPEELQVVEGKYVPTVSKEKIQPVISKYGLRPEGDKFHVINQSGKILTEQAMLKEDALTLIKQLEK